MMKKSICLILILCTSGCVPNHAGVTPPSAISVSGESVEAPAIAAKPTANKPMNEEASQRSATEWVSSPLQNEAAFCSIFLGGIASTLSNADRRADALKFGIMAKNVKTYLLEITGDRPFSKAQIEAMLRPISSDFRATREDVEVCTELGEAVSR